MFSCSNDQLDEILAYLTTQTMAEVFLTIIPLHSVSGFIQASLYNFLQQGMNAYYKGGFDPKMSKREAGLILGVRSVCFLFISHLLFGGIILISDGNKMSTQAYPDVTDF